MRSVGRSIARAIGLGSRPAGSPRSDGDQRLAAFMARSLGGVEAGYTAARTAELDAEHWLDADGLSADAQLDPETRFKLRNRSRHEIQNNAWAEGLVDTVVADEIGTGPRLIAQTGSRGADERIERVFAEWADAAGLGELLELLRRAEITDGEAFGRMTGGTDHAVTLGLEVIEADRFASPTLETDQGSDTDGIEFAGGRPVRYSILRRHPGDTGAGAGSLARDIVPADQVVHSFRRKRPGQSRGVPEIVAAIVIFARIRRYSLAVLGAAETAANHFATLHTDAPPDGAAQDESDLAYTSFSLSSGMTVLPLGWKMSQLRAEQPQTTFGEFVRHELAEAARSLGVPKAVALGDSSDQNFASGKLDRMQYRKVIERDRERIRRRVLEPLFRAWLREAALVEGLLPQSARTLEGVPHRWIWPGFDDIDRSKEAAADSQQLADGTTTRTAILARSGRTYRDLLLEVQRERELEVELDVTPGGQAAGGPPSEESEDDGAGQAAGEAEAEGGGDA